MNDLYIEKIFMEETVGDTSFQNETNFLDFLFSRKKYTDEDMRKTWDRGTRRGIEIGLSRASVEGQRVELHNNTTSERHKEFLRKFYELADKYNCAIQFHPIYGMMIVTQEK